MKVLIVYASHGGVSRRCAQMLASHLEDGCEITLVDARAEDIPGPQGYDAVVLGGSIRMGKLDKHLRNYIKTETESLSAVPTAVFICCGFTKLFDEYVETQLPKKLYCSLGYHLFGGELKPDKLSGFDKLVVKIVRNSIKSQDFEESDADHHDLPEIIPENVVLLARQIKSML